MEPREYFLEAIGNCRVRPERSSNVISNTKALRLEQIDIFVEKVIASITPNAGASAYAVDESVRSYFDDLHDSKWATEILKKVIFVNGYSGDKAYLYVYILDNSKTISKNGVAISTITSYADISKITPKTSENDFYSITSFYIENEKDIVYRKTNIYPNYLAAFSESVMQRVAKPLASMVLGFDFVSPMKELLVKTAQSLLKDLGQYKTKLIYAVPKEAATEIGQFIKNGRLDTDELERRIYIQCLPTPSPSMSPSPMATAGPKVTPKPTPEPDNQFQLEDERPQGKNRYIKWL